MAISILLPLAGCGPFSRSSTRGTLLAENILSEKNFSGRHISGDCVVTAYDNKGKKYFTTQTHEIYEQPVTIVAIATEPEGKIAWSLSDGKYETVSAEHLDYLLCNRQIASAILSLHLASGGLFGDLNGVELEPVRLDGKWYNPLEVRGHGVESDQIILFRSPHMKRIERVTVADRFGKNAFTAQGHDLRIFKDAGISIPGKIDVFSTGKAGEAEALVLQIDYKRLDLDRLPSADISPETVGKQKNNRTSVAIEW